MSRRILIGLMGLATALVGAGQYAPADAAPVSTERYVALGDSAAAGPVIVPQKPGPSACRRSERNFPSLTARALGIRDFVDATCSSAVTGNLTRPQGDARPQLDALTASTTLVTLGPIGANDANLVPLVLDCITPGCATRQGAAPIRKLDATRPRLTAALQTIRERAPRAELVVVGYGNYLPRGGCPAVQPLAAGDATYIQELLDHLNRILEETAVASGATFVALSDAPNAAQHTACAAPERRWLQGLVPTGTDGSVPLHPTARGMAAFAGAVTTAVREGAR